MKFLLKPARMKEIRNVAPRGGAYKGRGHATFVYLTEWAI